MKRSFNYILAALSMVALASCAKELVDVDETSAQTGTTFTFELPADEDESVDTKTAIIGKKTCWVSGDQIAVSDGETTEILTVPTQNRWNSITTIRSSKVFDGTVYAVYPVSALKGVTNGTLQLTIPAVQSGAFADCNIMVGKNVNNGFSMKNAAAVMKVDAYRDSLDITVIAPNGALSGTLNVTLAEDGTIESEEAANTSGAITVHAGKRGEYYVATIPGTYESGFTMMGVDRVSGLYESKTASSSNTLKASDIAKLGTIGTNLHGMEGSGTSYDPYCISNVAEWYLFAKSVNEGNDYEGETVSLTSSDVIATIPAGWYDATNKVDYYFKGTFDGNGNTITLALDAANAPSDQNIALFGELGEGAKIENVTVEGTVNAPDAQYVAGIAGCVNGGGDGVAITNCTNAAEINGKYYTSGIVSYADGVLTLSNDSNEGDVSGQASVAGILAYNNGEVELTSLTNTGDITSEGAYAAGIVAYHPAKTIQTITSCTNSGDISGTYYLGGIASYDAISGDSIEYCTNSGSVSGTYDVGGIVGAVYTPSVSNCTNSGSVTGSYALATILLLNGNKYAYMDPSCTVASDLNNSIHGVGGIVGFARNSSVVECTNNADVKGVTKVGGIYGSSYGASTASCQNSGAISASNGMVGGIGGFVYTVANSTSDVNSGAITGLYSVGGVIGMMNLVGYSSSSAKSTINGSSNSGKITAIGSTTFKSYSNGLNTVSAAGGIVGSTFEICKKSTTQGYLYLLSSSNSGEVTAIGNHAGGIVGIAFHGYQYSVSTVFQKVENTGNVTAAAKVGGILGGSYDRFCASGGMYIRDAENSGTVTGASYVGGVLGITEYQSTASASNGTRIYNAVNTGKIIYTDSETSYPDVGGIAGYLSHGTAQNIVNHGVISLNGSKVPDLQEYVGGTIGGLRAGTSTAKWCYSDAVVNTNLVSIGRANSLATYSECTVFRGDDLEATISAPHVAGNSLILELNDWTEYWSTYGYYNWKTVGDQVAFDK